MLLIVEDHKDTARALERLLEAEGYELKCIDTSQGALSFIRDVRPKLIIIDYMLPDLNGVDFLQQLKADPRACDVPVIIYSALAEPGVKQTAIANGAARWLTKGKDSWADLLLEVRQLYPLELT